jgi:hypothetical protein
MTAEHVVRQEYLRAVIECYRKTPGVLGHVRRADRDLAARLYDQRIPLFVIEQACLLAAARRIRNNAFEAPLPPIRSLHYFLPIIQEIRERPPGPRELEILRDVFGYQLL